MDVGRGFVGEAAGPWCRGVWSVGAVEGGGGEDEAVDVVGEGAEEVVWSAIGVGGGGEALVQAGEGSAQRTYRAAGGVGSSAGVVFLEIVDLFEFAEGFGFFRFGGVGVEDGFEFLLFFEEAAHGFAVVEGEAAFLEAGVAEEVDSFAGRLVHEGWEPELLAVDLGDFGGEVDGVDGVLGRVVQEPDDVEHALHVADDGLAVIEDEVPDAEALSECILKIAK